MRWDPHLPVVDLPNLATSLPRANCKTRSSRPVVGPDWAAFAQADTQMRCFAIEEATEICSCSCGVFMSAQAALQEHRRLGHFSNPNIPTLKVFCPDC